MNLAEHFEPMPAPDSGLQRVRRRARRRAVVQRLSSGTAALIVVLAVVGGLQATTNWLADTPSTSSGADSVNSSNGDVGFAELRPNETGLPGNVVSDASTLAVGAFALVLVIVVSVLAATAVGVVRAMRAAEPQLTTLPSARLLAACTALVAIGFVVIAAVSST